MDNLSFYKYLEAAFRYKLKNNDAPSFEYLGYKLPYETIRDKRGIFDYARKGKTALPRIYTNFPNTKEGNLQMAKKVLENLDRHLDQQLNKYFNQATIPNENVSVAGGAQAEQAAAAQTGGMPPTGVPGTGGMPSVSTIKPRLPHNIPQVTKEEATEKTVAPKDQQTSKSPSQPKIPNLPQTPSISSNLNSSAFRSRVSNLAKRAQNFASPANPFLKTNLNRLGNGLKNMFGNAANFGGRTGLGAINHGGNFLSNLSDGRSRLAGGLKGAKSRVSSLGEAKKLGLGLGLFFMIFFMAALGGILSNTSPGETAPNPTPGNNSGLDYTLPLKNPAVQPLDIRDQIQAAFPGAKIEYWDTIIQRSKTEGWNPAMVLALWIEETGASQATLIKNGGSEILTNGSLSKGHLGCATAEDQTIDESLNCFFNFVAANNFADDQFPQLMAKYSGGPANDPFSNNPNFLAVFKNWYSKLVPTGVGMIQSISAGGCPTAGTISTPYGFNIADYPDVSNFGCGTLSQCHSGIDIASSQGAPVKSSIEGVITVMSTDSLKGKYIEIQNSITGISIDLEHLENYTSGLSVNSQVRQGTTVGTVGQTGQVSGFTLHYRINKGSTTLNPFRYLGIAPSSSAKTSSDDISQNDYSGVAPSNNWGQCN